ncbi:MAG: hypothetical protein CVT94_07560 [Bacteroidetes bacterium HGW-Bacteroidetes-11]|jgi:hypothetical protein|nr:MAG: hypothetical protein CVT94_07560 [Bacteroidetes bacterium HGW-Bacteroidetes-11]
MKQVILSLLLFLCALIGVQAQTQTVVFEYDAAGNRELRIIAKKITKADTLFNTDSLFAEIPEAPINGLRVYPNPARESVNIEFSTLPEAKVEFSLSDINGRLLEKGKITEALTPLNLQNIGKGTYLLLIKAGAENEKYKIIKQ